MSRLLGPPVAHRIASDIWLNPRQEFIALATRARARALCTPRMHTIGLLEPRVQNSASQDGCYIIYAPVRTDDHLADCVRLLQLLRASHSSNSYRILCFRHHGRLLESWPGCASGLDRRRLVTTTGSARVSSWRPDFHEHKSLL